MATIKAIEAKSVHQIQSGQVIVDLCSVAKELVENSLDAGATSVEVRFKNYGLDSIEVQDNGSGISPANYDNIALKHYTSKLSSYDDLSNLRTFGFRGEALSSLCALSKFSIVTAQADEAPKGKRLEFDTMGRLKSTTVVASQKGCTASVEDLFESLPVRRKELAKNVKREYGKVLGLLHAYAAIGINVKFTLKHAISKGKSMVVFATKGNTTTRENIANVYGAKTLAGLVPLDLELDFQPTSTHMTRKDISTNIRIQGHISKPVFGEGRQTPDRQMFFVNGRPCGLPQIAKAINEVYKSFNVSQSPFIFADFIMDTNAYDVNVSPDKRTILLHDSAALIDSLKSSLIDMFEQQDQTVPQSQLHGSKLPAFKKLTVQRHTSNESTESANLRRPTPDSSIGRSESFETTGSASPPLQLFKDHFGNFASTREEPEAGKDSKLEAKAQKYRMRLAEKVADKVAKDAAEDIQTDRNDASDDALEHAQGTRLTSGEEDEVEDEDESEPSPNDEIDPRVRDFNARMAEANAVSPATKTDTARDMKTMIKGEKSVGNVADHSIGVMPSAFDRMRPRRAPAELATITIGDQTVTTILGTQFPRDQGKSGSDERSKKDQARVPATIFSQKLRQYGAQRVDRDDGSDDESIHDADPVAESDSDREDNEVEEVEEVDSGSDGPASKSVSEIDEDAPQSHEVQSDDPSDELYVDELEKKKEEEARVAELIRAAEESASIPSKENLRRATKALTTGRSKDSTTSLMTTIRWDPSSLAEQISKHDELNKASSGSRQQVEGYGSTTATDAETRLSLTVSKGDFAKMQIVGQFNLGFIIAVRPAESSDGKQQDELFIIDQHASDEKYNFERLQAETVVGNQRLVRPVVLDLTAVEEEIVLEHQDALERNGFQVEIDTSGDKMVGQRCSLISLPLSKEVVFEIQDLEELIQLLAEAPTSSDTSCIPRPSKVRKMFAMRACRSSIMIGKTLSSKQMEKVVTHMGTIDKPWNCPHGRPTMRHLCSLNSLDPWLEGDEEDGERGLGMGKALHEYIQPNSV